MKNKNESKLNLFYQIENIKIPFKYYISRLYYSLLLPFLLIGNGMNASAVNVSDIDRNNIHGKKSELVCSLSISKISVGECTYNETTGLSRTLVAVFLNWSEAPAGQNIVVTYKGQTKTLNPATPGIPNFVQFIVAADGSSNPVTAAFSGGGCTASPMTATIPESCTPQPCGAAGTIGGRVFYDFNNNGTQQTSEYGIKNVGVKIYNDFNQLLCQTTTGVNGLWRCNGLPVNTKVRVEFNPPASFKTSKPGGNNASEIQFATVGSCSVNYGIYETKNFMDADPWMVIPCYTKGDPNVPGSPVAQEPTIVANRYMTPSGSRESNNYYVSNASETGTVWGLCYQPETKSLLSSAFLRRHTMWGPGGLGAIYKTNMTAFLSNPDAAPNKRLFNQTSIFINLDDYGINTGDEASLARDIVANPSTPTRDILAFQNIGKMGLGDMDLNDKRDSLFIVNLFNKSIVTIKIGNPVLATIPAGNVNEIPIPDPGCSAEGDWRPFGLKYKDGIIYVGGVCSGESTQNASDMRAIVYAYSNGTFTEIVNIKLDYVKGKLQGTRESGCYDFIPWTNDWSKLNYGGTGVCGPSPMLTDIEFDGYGNLILGVGDRAGYQVGFNDYGPFPTGNTTFNGFAGGDILKLYNNNGTFLMENNGTSGYFTSAGANAGEGINGGEFYYQDGLVVCCHNETVLGGLAVHPSDDAVITTVIDAVNIFANGWKMLSNTTGAQTRVYDIFVSSGGDITFNKAAGLGDLELLQSSSATGGLNLQVGNYIWQDSDLDGIQDPSESPVPNIPVSLYKKVNGVLTFIGSTTTNASGQYFFNDLLPDMDYVIAVGNPQNYSLDGYFEANGTFYLSTTANAAGSNDQNDSDATPGDASLGILKGVNTICFKTGALGENNYTLDIGLVPPGIGNFVWKDDNFNGRQDAGEEGVQGAVLKLHACANGIPGAVVPGYTKTTNSIGYYNFQNVPQGTYAISYDFSGLANSNNMYFSIPNIEGNTVDNVDSDPKYVLPGNKVEFGACFNWDGNPAGLDYSHDAGIVCDKDKDGIPDDFDDNDLLIDPTGYLYCEHTGEILDGGSISISGPGNVYLIYDGSSGYYQYFVDATGIYTMTVNDPPGFVRSIKCPDLGFLDAPDSLQIFNPYSVGSGNDNGDDFLDDYTCSVNRLYITMLLEPGDYITNNNIPYQCSDLGDLPAPYPTLLSDNGPLHGVMQTPSLYMGALVDKEFDGSPEACAGDETGGDDKDKAVDDEDGIANMPLFIISQTSVVTVNVTNRSGVAAKLIGFMDLNGDGDFNDSGEMSMASVPNGTNNGTRNLSFTVPLDAPAGQKVGLRLRLSTDTEIEPTGTVRFGEIEDYMVQIVGFDFGDLPDSYNTSGDDFPPKHLVTESLKLGSSVDAELDGFPDPMAGSMGAGDDGDPGLVTFGTSTPAGDDENGVMLASPMIPGYAATFMVTAMNMTTANAVLQAWVDFNGNGSFEANEQLTTGSFAPNGANIPVGGLNGAKLNFNVPASATFYQGNAMVRFRLSSEGNLAPNSQIGFLPFGEIEDYKFPLGKVGNIVFEDRDFDGTQDSGEPGIDGVSVAMVWGGPDGNVATTGDNLTYTTTTGPSSGQQTGEYYFCGLIDGTYKMIFTSPANMTPTRSNIGSQVNGSTVDSDGTITGMDLSMAMESFTIANVTALPTGENGLGDAAPSNVGTFPDAQTDETHDQGFAFLDYGDLPESGNGDNFNTTMAESGAVHVIIPGLKLGASVDGERNGFPVTTADGDDNSNTGSTDDEDGVSFVTPLIPGYSATIAVTAMNMTGSNAVLQGWIDWNNNGLLDASEALAFTNNGVVPAGGVTNVPYTFPVPAGAIFNDGMVFARFRLSPNGGQSADGPDKYNATTVVPQGEVEDYKLDVAKIGNYVWEDRNFNGLQDSGEPPISGVAVAMIWGGADGNVATTGDNVTYTTTTGPASSQQAGEYYFCGLIPGTYKLVYTSPDNMTPTRSNIGSQVNGSTGDSDGLVTGMDMSMAMETFTIACAPCQPLGENGTGDNGTAPTGTFPDLHTDETHDQGFAFLDYGDLPETGNGDNFNTTMAESGAVHVIIPGLKLGASVDGERNGFPVTTADGDDNSNTGSTDDEDGVNFVTPLIPGYSATIAVTAMNMTGSNAVLQGWIDWNNNGLLDASEALAFTNNGVVPAGGVTSVPYTFPVPAGAIFNDGMVFARFRLSPNGGQSADGPDKYNATTVVPQGEVEDYKLDVAKIGNYVWEDRNFNGLQDAGEPPINGVAIAMIWGGADGDVATTGDNLTYTTTTGPASSQQAGEYYFCGLIPGTYKLVYTSPDNMTPTRSNIGTQTNGSTADSDGLVTGMDMSMAMETFTIANVTALPTGENGPGDRAPANVGTFPDAQTDETHDQGFAYLDYGDLPESGNGENFNTTMAETGAVHVIIPGLKLGASVDGERNGFPVTTSDGDDNSNTGSVDDEDGVSFVTPLIPGYSATIAVTAMNMTGSNAVLQGWIDWNNNGLLDASEALAFTNNGIVPAGGVTNAPYTFPVPATAIFNDGMVFARFRLSPNGGQSADGPDKYNAATTVPAGEVEDYKKNLVKVGNIVWEDYDFDGQQDTNEPGIGNMPVGLIWAGADGNLMTPADNVMYSTSTLNADSGGNVKGEYNFCGLIEGTYKIAISSEPGYAPTLPNTGDQTNGGYTDSDGILVPAGAFPGIGGAMVMTDPIVITLAGITQQPTTENGKGDNSPNVLGTFPNNQTNESYDFGFVAVDYGDLPNTYVTFNGGNNIGAMHVIQPGKYLGMGVDAEMDANVDAAGTAGMWAGGDDNGVSPLFYGMVTNGDDEDGVSFISPLVPGYKATVRVKYTAIDLPGLVRTNNTYLSGWVDFNGNGIFDASDKVISDLPLATGTNVMRDIDIMVPLSATFTGGAARARFRIHCQPGMGSAGLAISGEVEDYYIPVAKAGNYVWFDNDLRGDEMITNQPFNFLAEAGINDVDMVMVWGGLDGNLSTTADNRVYRKKTATGTLGENQDGIYYFCGLIQGNYTVMPRKYAGVIGLGTDSLVIPQAILATPSRKILTIANNVAGNDYKDSDATPAVNFNVPDLLASPTATLGTLNENLLGDLPTIYGFPDRLTNMGLDFGFVQEPNIELNQKIAGIERGGECGRFKVVMDLCIQNSGGSENGYKMAVPLNSIQANVPLADQLGGAFLMTMGTPRILNGAGNWECDEAAMPQQLPAVNPAFNGRSDTRLFTDNTGLLYPGEKVVVRYVFELDPYAIPAVQARNLSVQASGSGKAVNYQGQPVPDFYNSGNQYMAMDLSNDGLEFNGTYNDPDGKTYIGDCWESSQQSLAANNHVYIAVSPTNCFTDVEDAMILEGEKEKCTDGAFCLEGYYRVTLKDLSGNIVPNPVPPTYIGKTIIAEVENIISCNKTWGYVTFEYKHPPVVTCQDVVVKCGDDITNLPKPLVQSCVDIVRMEFRDYPGPKGCDSDYWQTIERSWQVEDELGMTSSCIQRINVERNTLTNICNSLDNYNGTDKAPLSCTENWKKDASGNPHPDVTGYPQPNGCNVSCIYSDLVFEGCGNSKSIIRTWICSDQCSNALAECEQRIDVKDVEGPTFVSLSTPVFGPPSIDGCVQGVRFSLPEMHDDCSDEITVSIKVGAFGGAFVDGVFPAQGFAALPIGTHEVTYTAIDNCGNATNYTTTITIVDKTAPVVVTKQNIIVSLVPGGIGYQGYARLYNTSVDAGSFDACSGVKVELRRPNGAPACYNNGKRTGDGQEYNNNVTFNNEVPRLHANDSSLDTDGGEFVSFCCEDLTTGVDTDGDGQVNVGYHEVIVRVWDDADRDNVFGSAGDNYNESWAYVKVEDKLPPVITCPPNMTIFCDWAIDMNIANGDASAKSVAGFDFSKTGLPVAYGVCGVTDIKFWDREVVDQCDLGYIDRTFLATGNGQTVKCVQRITVQQSPAQAPWTFIPSSLSTTPIATSCDGPTQADIDRNAPKYTAGPCDVIGVSTKTWQFDFEGGVCRKWKVEYKYTNWCTGEEKGPYAKYFIYEDKVAPVMTCEDKMFAVDGNCEASVTLAKVATDESGCVSGGGWLKWEVYVDLWADGSQDLMYSSFYAGPQGVAKTISINGTAHTVRQYTLAPTTSGQEAKFTLPEPIEGKMSNHKVVWKVTDGCHNWESCSETFMVTDKKAPTPVCVNLSTALMQDPDGSGPLKPMVELWAIDFMNKSYDNCTDTEDLLYTFDDWAPQVEAKPDGAGNPMSIDHAHFFGAQGGVASAVNTNTSVYKAALAKYLNGEIQLWVPSSRSAAKVWVADNYNADTYKEVDVHVTVWDKKFNHDFCWTTIRLLHGGEGAQPKIAGNVSTPAGQGLKNAMINVEADINEYPRSVATAADGNYQMEVQAANTYEITAAKTGDFLNGVSTLDLVLIQRHILGLQKLDSPYKLIAADANNDGKVTAADLTELRKLILGVTSSFTNNQSWRFPVKEQIMNPTTPFPFVEKIVKDVLTTDVTGLDFVAVKIGDVNGNVSTNVADPITESRSSKAVVLAVNDQDVVEGQEVSVPVTAADFSDVMGYQFTMKLHNAAFAGIEKGALNVDASNVGVLAGGIVTMSFASTEALTVKEGDVLFTLKVKAAKTATMSEIIALNSEVTPAEAYTTDLKVTKVSLEVRSAPEEGITLYQNEPNPFLGATKVSFYMPKAAKATLTLFDVTGKLVTTRNIDAVKGMNSEVFTREQLQTSGVLYYTLESGDFTATKKMIIIE